MSNATPGDMWRDLNYNLDRGGNPSEWTTSPRQWIGYTEDSATGEKLRYNEYGNEEERALAEYVKSQHDDLITLSATQSALAEVDPYMYSSRPEWLGGTPNWRQNFSYATSGLAEKFRTDYDSPRGMFDQKDDISFENYRPSDYLDLGIGALTMLKNISSYMMASMAPQMAQNIGDAPFKVQRCWAPASQFSRPSPRSPANRSTVMS